MRCLPHEVRDHPDADLSSRLEHLWRRSNGLGDCSTILVASQSKSSASTSISVVPLCGTRDWSTLGGDTRSFIQVVKAPLQPKTTMNQRPNYKNRGVAEMVVDVVSLDIKTGIEKATRTRIEEVNRTGIEVEVGSGEDMDLATKETSGIRSTERDLYA